MCRLDASKFLPVAVLVGLMFGLRPGSAAAQPAADPADVATIDAIITASYDVISGPAGDRDWDRERSLFHPESRHKPTQRKPSGGSSVQVMTVEGFIEASSGFFAQSAFYEYEIARSTQRYGDIAHVFSTYAWGTEKDGPVKGRGINSFQLLWDGDRWWIVSIFWSQESEDSPIPAEFLPGDGEGSARVEPERVAPGVVSVAGRNETFPAEDPATGDLWFSVYDGSFDDQTIMVARKDGTTWSSATVAPFSGTWGDRAPRFSPDGSELYFTSNRPRSGTEPEDMNLWRVERTSAGGWSEPRLAGGSVNTEAAEIHASLTDSGIWFASNREGSLGRSDIFRVPVSSGAAEHASAPLNDELSQPDLYVSPDESWMILVVTDHAEGLGGDDLFIVEREADTWTTPRHLGAPINSDEYEYGPTSAPGSQWLYFTSHRSGDADVYRVPVKELLR